MPGATSDLVERVRRCTLCRGLPLGPRPILQYDPAARILIAGQAPGRKTHAKGIPFDDPSGVRLRQWLGVTDAQFYDARLFAIVPMGFCYPGTGKRGDLPPRPECAPAWREKLLNSMTQCELQIIIGRYAIDWHLDRPSGSVTELVAAWRGMPEGRIVLPHPSPRNNRWLRQNPWFEEELLPALRTRVATIIA